LTSLLGRRLKNVVILAASRPIQDLKDFMRVLMEKSEIIQLKQLSDEDVRHLILLATKSKLIAPDLLVFIQRHSNGNPLFAKQLILSLSSNSSILVDTQGQCKFSPTKSEEEKQSVSISFTIESVVMSRLDQLDVVQQKILKMASVIGFYVNAKLLFHLLDDISSENEQFFPSQLFQLIDLELLDAPSYSKNQELHSIQFRHILISEAIYNSLSFATRREVHGKIANWMKNNSGFSSSTTVAYHFEKAEHFAESVEFYEFAGIQAFQCGSSSQ